MAKYIVRCYYEYVGKGAVEANSMEEAFAKGLEICNEMTTADLYYVGGINAVVMDENGGEQQFDID
jgi:hypothetical protein